MSDEHYRWWDTRGAWLALVITAFAAGYWIAGDSEETDAPQKEDPQELRRSLDECLNQLHLAQDYTCLEYAGEVEGS